MVWGVGGQTLANTYNKLSKLSILYVLGDLQALSKLQISKTQFAKNFHGQ